MKIMVILGSARKNGAGVRVTNLATEAVNRDGRLELDFVNVADLGLPFFDEDFSPKYKHYQGKDYTNPEGKAWAKRVAAADGFIFITPEYNHSIPAALKNALDWVGPEWDGKPVGFIGYSVVPLGGVRAVEHLRQIAPELGLAQTTRPVLIGNVLDAVSEDGSTEDDGIKAALNTLLDDLHAFKQLIAHI